MRKITIIPAAGWKGAGSGSRAPKGTQPFLLPLELCPESLLPIGGGETILSRLVRQVRARGYQLLIGIARPGTLYPHATKRHFNENLAPPEIKGLLGTSPWTRAKVSYVKSLGTTIFVDDPDMGGSRGTVCAMIESFAEGTVDEFLMVCGDTLVTDAVLDVVDSLSPSFMLDVVSREVIYKFDAKGARAYVRLVKSMGAETFEWNRNKYAIQHSKIKTAAPEVGITHYQKGHVKLPPAFMDVDRPNHYREALGRWLVRYGAHSGT